MSPETSNQTMWFVAWKRIIIIAQNKLQRKKAVENLLMTWQVKGKQGTIFIVTKDLGE